MNKFDYIFNKMFLSNNVLWLIGAFIGFGIMTVLISFHFFESTFNLGIGAIFAGFIILIMFIQYLNYSIEYTQERRRELRNSSFNNIINSNLGISSRYNRHRRYELERIANEARVDRERRLMDHNIEFANRLRAREIDLRERREQRNRVTREIRMYSRASVHTIDIMDVVDRHRARSNRDRFANMFDMPISLKPGDKIIKDVGDLYD